jgi:hypothetical protein
MHANINEAPSLIIKIDGLLLTEQLFAIPREDKDHQGRTRVYISNEHQFVNQDSTKTKTKSRVVDERRSCNYLYPHLLDWTVQRKAECKREIFAQRT